LGQARGDANRAAQAGNPLRGAGSQPVEPFRVIGNIYYVGAVAISSHIIVTSEGLILLDTGTEQMLPGILGNIEKLGFRWQDIKIILSSHAHWDHVEGHAAMKERTGAQVMALGEDAVAIAAGVDNSAIGAAGWTPAAVDRTLRDGDVVALGDVSMQAHLTAGHTKGCTTWTTTVREGQQQYLVVFVGGTSINQGVRLRNNARHPGIVEDYARTFQTLKQLRADVFLAQHPSMYDMSRKRQQMIDGATQNPFVDSDGYQRFVREEEGKFVAQLQQETAGR
jgi:metallo-beta-lactamase class B